MVSIIKKSILVKTNVCDFLVFYRNFTKCSVFRSILVLYPSILIMCRSILVTADQIYFCVDQF